MTRSRAPRRPTPRSEHQVGNYRFVRLIGEGGMGQVYEVKHVELGRRAALKMLLPDLAQNEEMAARFFMEARAMSMVEHPALTHVYEYGHLDDGGAYIVMEYIEGESLRELLIKRGGSLPFFGAVSWARQIAAGLQAAHDKGVVHRDLKPENVMLVTTDGTSGDSRIKILDFGVAKTLDGSPDAQLAKTRPGQVIGTPMYMAPEQAEGPGKIGGHTDVYALGVVLFEMLSGRPPFTGENAVDVVGKHMFATPPRLREVMPGADPEMEDLILRMLAKTPESRPGMREVRSKLGQILKRAEARSDQEASELEDSSEAETLVLRKSKPPRASVPTEFLSTRLIGLPKTPLRLAIGILIIGFLGLGIWLVLSGTHQSPPSGASSPAGSAQVTTPSKQQNDSAATDGKKGSAGATRSIPDEADKGSTKRRPKKNPVRSSTPSGKQSDSAPEEKGVTPKLVD